MNIDGYHFRDDGYKAPGTCKMCGARWPAWVTTEAYTNRKRAAARHPGKPCDMNPKPVRR